MSTSTERLSLPSASTVRHQVEQALRDFLKVRQSGAEGEPPMPEGMPRVLENYLLHGGKRLRSLLCVTGWYAGGGRHLAQSVVQVAASLEMFHACALLHDDVMDDSRLRRGLPTAHRSLAREPGGVRAQRFGTSAAILLGDLALSWSDELLRTAGLTPRQLRLAGAEMDSMRRVTVYGQYQDLLSAHLRSLHAEEALFIAHFKTARYTVDAPLRIGAVLAGAEQETLCRLSEFAIPLGIAFQLRDDVLGVFGRPEETGKSCSEDLREGKCTLLAALGVADADSADARRLRELLKGPLTGAQETEARRLLISTGARESVESRITHLQQEALDALTSSDLPAEVVESLRHLAARLTVRTA
ncbi:polyprenyl synthetase family protein [Streptomyces sp. NPDC020801]|uniref:polyprenyl synthetase family protein n=1 Tax=unclassified Streptomyces TaxID=2593676 RepID=UPI0037A88108